MFIVPPNNFNGTPQWNPYPMFSEPPMIPLPNFDMMDDTRQKPLLEAPPNRQNPELPPTSPIVNNPLYNQGWLTRQIGKYIKIEFLIGTSMLIDREGILKEVGISFIVIQESGTNDMLMCDIYSIKFVRVFDPQPVKCIP
ncbi:hypothetical protein [Clostridium sp. CF012]|uniref:hypothetical protein n=1 Tax=Clostridium sp. CF012 TaxID=2843319 RepID=UPI001C0C1811|nr:hypothetical protein [Clostridium sp. CF012]MBU3146639.1 hypothetical protein [Clostridium sp. CF012]